MSERRHTGRPAILFAALLCLGACGTQREPHAEASNPPPIAPGGGALWYSVNFDSNSSVVSPGGRAVLVTVAGYLTTHPHAVATIIGKTDSVGSPDYNMHLSHLRADAVRDGLVYDDKVPADRVETRWTGERRQDVATAGNVAAAANRVVDIAIH